MGPYRKKTIALTIKVLLCCICFLFSSTTAFAYSFPEVTIQGKYGAFSAETGKNKGDIVLTVRNSGQRTLANGILKLGTLPNGISLENGQSSSRNISQLNTNKEDEESYTLSIGEDVKTGVYPISLTFSGKYGDDLESDYQTEQTFYLQVTNAKLDEEKEESNLILSDMKAPTEAFENKEFSVSFSLTNRGPSRVEQVKISADGSGLVNKTQNVIVEPSLEVGQTKDYSMTFYGSDTLETGNYPIKISVEPGASSSKNAASFPAVSQYVGVFLTVSDKDAAENSVKQPQLMVKKYNYGDAPILSGSQFTLSLTMKNTSDQKALRNIKVSMTSEDGSLIPIDSSHSRYIDYLPVHGQSEQKMTFSVKPDTPSQQSVLCIESVYEDMDANVIQNKELISIPIQQKTQLEIGDIVVPSALQVGQSAVLNVDFSNTGKTTLNNLKVVASGAFTLSGSPTTYVGNLEPGQNGAYQLTFTPNDEGTLEGSLTFEYNDDQGTPCSLVKPFTVEVSEALFDPATTESQFPWLAWGLGGFAILLVLGVLWHRRKTRVENLPDDVDREE